MSCTLIIGYGNPLRGDDALGHYAVQRLSELVDNETVKLISCHQLTPELAAEASKYDKVIFIDASIGEKEGVLTVTRLDHTQLPKPAISHQLEPESVLAYSSTLYGKTPDAYLVTITAGSFGYMEGLSDAVLSSLPELTDAVLRITGIKLEVYKNNHQKVINIHQQK